MKNEKTEHSEGGSWDYITWSYVREDLISSIILHFSENYKSTDKENYSHDNYSFSELRNDCVYIKYIGRPTNFRLNYRNDVWVLEKGSKIY